MTRTIPLALGLCLLLGCGATPQLVQHRALERASFDLGCPMDSLEATQLGDTTRIGLTPDSPGIERTVVGVTGCGHKAVYLVECARSECNALLNADTRPAPTPNTDVPPDSVGNETEPEAGEGLFISGEVIDE